MDSNRHWWFNCGVFKIILFNIYLTNKELQRIINLCREAKEKELVQNIKEQIFKKECEIKDWEFIDECSDR